MTIAILLFAVSAAIADEGTLLTAKGAQLGLVILDPAASRLVIRTEGLWELARSHDRVSLRRVPDCAPKHFNTSVSSAKTAEGLKLQAGQDGELSATVSLDAAKLKTLGGTSTDRAIVIDRHAGKRMKRPIACAVLEKR